MDKPDRKPPPKPPIMTEYGKAMEKVLETKAKLAAHLKKMAERSQ